MTRRTLSAAAVAGWADVADDHNPLHLDPDFAAGTRFGRPIVHGSLLFALVCDALQEADAGWTTSGQVRVRFRCPVPVGEAVDVRVSDGDVHLRYGRVEPAEINVRTEGERP